jgi:SPP1 gp7 family putative phage head morphogenesis protein
MLDFEPLPIDEAIEFWRDKVQLSSRQFRQLSDAAKNLAFAVSGIAKGDELTTVFEAMNGAIAKGDSFGEFKKQCREIIERRGWTGKKAWRVDNIFRTNIQTAYSVGRYRQMMEVAQTRPYWQYSAVNDARTRPTHRALHGRVFPADHPFWKTWYPPNGYNCRCGVVTLSKAEMEREGLTAETQDPTGRLIEPIDPKTGNRMLARPLMPDPGFAHNPGETVWGGLVDAASRPGTWTAMPNLRGPADYRRRALENVRPAEIADFDETMLLARGKGDAFYKKAFVERYGEEKLLADAVGEPVILSLRAYLEDKSPGAEEAWKFSKGGHGESIPLLEKMISDPYEIWLTPQINEAGRIRLAKRYIALWKTANRERIGGYAALEVADGSFQGVTAFLPLKKGKPAVEYVEVQRLGLLLFRRGR